MHERKSNAYAHIDRHASQLMHAADRRAEHMTEMGFLDGAALHRVFLAAACA
jgi:hypothetical protein